MITALEIRPGMAIPMHELELEAIRSQGAGGQNVNKVASAIHLRFDINASTLPEWLKTRLLERTDQRLSKDGVLIIKAQRFRTQEKNRNDALERLRAWVLEALVEERPRIATRPSRASQQRRVQAKQRRSTVKSLRGKVRDE